MSVVPVSIACDQSHIRYRHVDSKEDTYGNDVVQLERGSLRIYGKTINSHCPICLGKDALVRGYDL